MVIQKALSAFAHCNLATRQHGLEEHGIRSITNTVDSGSSNKNVIEKSVDTIIPTESHNNIVDDSVPPETSIKDVIVGELMNNTNESLKSVLLNKFGIILDYVGIEQIKIPDELAVQMQKQAIATASGRANILEAESKAASAKAIAEGDREVLKIKADTDKALAEIRAKAQLIAAEAVAAAIRKVGEAKKETMNGLSKEAVQIMVSKEVAAAIRAGKTTLISKSASDLATMIGMNLIGSKTNDTN